MLTTSIRRQGLVPSVLWAALLLGGCSGTLRPDNTENVKLDEVGEVTLEVIDEAAFGEVLEQSRGKVVLVDFWATWCGPCKELFPHAVELHNRLADKGLVVISVSLDDPDEDRAQVLEFLANQESPLENFISQYGSGSESFEVFAITNGALPHFKLYDRSGKLHRTFASGDQLIDPKEIDRAVEGLLAKR